MTRREATIVSAYTGYLIGGLDCKSLQMYSYGSPNKYRCLAKIPLKGLTKEIRCDNI